MDNLGGLLSHILVSETHLGGEGAVRLPLGRGTGSGLLHHLVDLLEGETLGLRDEEVGVDKGTGAERSPDEEDLGLEVTLVSVDHVGGDDSDDLYEGSQQGIQFFFFFFRIRVEEKLTQFQSQLEAVDRATPRERMGRG